MRSDYYKAGDWNAICDQCGAKRKFSELKKTWDNFYVCSSHWEPRHPQDKLRGVKDNQSVPVSRPEGEDSFLGTNEVTVDDL